MFYLYQSNRLESLAALFAGIQRVRPLESALAAEQIVVQSQGMRRYLSVYLARELGVAANLQFSLPAGLTWQLMQKLIPDIPALSPFSPEVMRWRLLDLFRSERFQTTSEFENVRSVLQSYLGSGESADYQLAGQLADIFDQYLVYRPQWIDAWQEGKLLGLGEDEVWQAQLWRYLDDGNQSAPHRVALWEKLLSSLDKAHLPERFFVFGISTMAPMYLQLLQKISEHCDVFVFALNPSGLYWGNVIEAAQLLKGGDEADLSQTGHPLLASLGKQGRDFFDFLTEIGLEEQPVFEEVSDDTLLHCLQNDIQNLRMPSEHSRADLLDDGSIRIVSAHSPLRELQILKDKLLRILHEHPDWQPHDIAVLTPNIEPYSPFIEAVFGQAQGGAQALPYSVSDVKLSRRQPLLYALEQTLDLLESRFEVDKVLPLLESGLVLRRFGLTADDLPLLHDTIAELNVHWGLDGTMRGAADNLFTWQQALERIVLGWMLPDDGSPLWQNVSAWYGDVNRLDVFGRFAAFIRTLSRLAAEWRKPAAAEEWTERCRDLVQSLFLPDADDQYALQQFEQALAKWQEETALAGFRGTLPQHTVIRHIRRFLGSESQAGFLRGGITFCSMVPMRSLPFKVICLLGLNDGDFPRNTKAAVFDLIAQHPQKGDRARRDDDRYLFLEAIISARDNPLSLLRRPQHPQRRRTRPVRPRQRTRRHHRRHDRTAQQRAGGTLGRTTSPATVLTPLFHRRQNFRRPLQHAAGLRRSPQPPARTGASVFQRSPRRKHPRTDRLAGRLHPLLEKSRQSMAATNLGLVRTLPRRSMGIRRTLRTATRRQNRRRLHRRPPPQARLSSPRPPPRRRKPVARR